MDDTVSPRKAAIAARAFKDGLLIEEAPLIGVIDTDALRGTIDDLRSSFPNFFQHAFAAKANTMPAVLNLIRGWGMSCEVASPGEYQAAVRAGFTGGEIVFDSPAKTNWEINAALSHGATLNIDNFQELARVDAWLAKGKSKSIIGLRINPQVGGGAIAARSVAAVLLTEETAMGCFQEVRVTDPSAASSAAGSSRCSSPRRCSGTSARRRSC